MKKRITKRCYLCKSVTTKLYTINDATLFPKKYNKKKICAQCKLERKLLKAEPA